MKSKKGPLYKRVNEIDELYSSPKIRQYCRELARELHEQTANFIQKIVDDPKFDLSNCPWPFGLIIVEERKGKKRGETKSTQLYRADRTTRRWRTPDDIAAVHTFLALFRDERLEYGDRIVTYETRNICPYIGTSSLIRSDTTEMLEKELPALIRCAREDLKAGVIPVKNDSDSTSDNKVPWDEKDPNFYENKKAIVDAMTVGREYDIDELVKLDNNYDKLRKLLMKPACTIKFMSVKSPQPRGRVHKNDWQKYLKSQIKQAQILSIEVEQEIRSRMS